jgi:thiol:disulfide interchange protein DsbC
VEKVKDLKSLERRDSSLRSDDNFVVFRTACITDLKETRIEMEKNKTSFSIKAFHLSLLAAAVLSILAGAGRLHAQCMDSSMKKTAVAEIPAEKIVAATAECFKRDFPDVALTKIEESGIEGLYEVTTGINIAYYAPANGRVIFGELFDKTGKNITAEKRQILIALQEAETTKLIDALPLDKAIRIGRGKNVVIEFTDIDCPYCRKVEGFFKNRHDITRYVFLFPLEQLHPQSFAKSREVLCSKDPASAYQAAIEGELDKVDLKGCSGKEKDIDRILAEYKTTAAKMGISGTPMMWVNKKQVTGADTRKIEEYLASETTETANVPGL